MGIVLGLLFLRRLSHLNNPYPTGQGGASVPGFDALNLGRSQLVNLGETKTFGAATVNELRLSFMRSCEQRRPARGGVGPSLASQGFVTGVGTPGIVPLAPSIEGIENIIFNSFVIGNSHHQFEASEQYVFGDRQFLKVWVRTRSRPGLNFSYEQVNVNPDPTFNGSFLFSGIGNRLRLRGLSDRRREQLQSGRLAGLTTGATNTPRLSRKIAGEPRRNLTLNYGVRWELMQYWSEKYNQIPTFIPGEQSRGLSDRAPGLVYPTIRGAADAGARERTASRRDSGLAYSPAKSERILGENHRRAGENQHPGRLSESSIP